MKITEALRHAATEHTRTKEHQAHVARQCGISKSMLSRFVAGKSGLSIDAADRLAAYLGLTLCSTTGGKV